MAFYVVELLVERRTPVLFFLSSCALLGSVGLFTLLTVVMRDFCVVCMSIYVVNIITFFVAKKRFFAARDAVSAGATFGKRK